MDTQHQHGRRDEHEQYDQYDRHYDSQRQQKGDGVEDDRHYAYDSPDDNNDLDELDAHATKVEDSLTPQQRRLISRRASNGLDR